MEDSASRTENSKNSRKSILTLPPTIISRIYFVLTCLLQLNLFFSLYARWHDFIQRLITLKDIILTLFCSLSFMRLMGGDTIQLCEYIEEHLSSINIDKKLLTNEQNSIIENREHRFETTNKIIKRYFYLLTIVSGLIPYVKGLKAALIANFTNKNVKLHFLLSIHYPEEYKSLLLEMAVQTLLLLWYISFVHYWITDMKVMSLSFQCITTEMELLRNSIEDMDAIVERSIVQNDPEKLVKSPEETALQSYISKIVRTHQSICRRVEFFNGNMKNVIVFLMNIYAIQLCLFLVIIVEMPDILSKVRDLLRYFIILSLVFFISRDGEKVTSEGKNLRNALWMCSWTDKPNWLKKSLLTMMTRATVDLKIKPYNLYSLDLSCFALIVKGTYSYFNIYKSLRK